MAVKLSSYYWFRNNYLVRSLEDEHTEMNFFNGRLSPDDRKTLKFILEELDELKKDSDFQQGEPLMDKNVVIPNVVELKDVTSKPQLAAEYFRGIYGIMEKYCVQLELYNQLSNCFKELDIAPNPDVAEAINYAFGKIHEKKFGCLERMCWQSIKKRGIREYIPF